METPKRDTEFIDNILISKTYTKKFKKQLKKFVKTVIQVDKIELENMLLDLHKDLDEQGLKTGDKSVQNSYAILIVITQDEIKFRKDNPGIYRARIRDSTGRSKGNRASRRK